MESDTERWWRDQYLAPTRTTLWRGGPFNSHGQCAVELSWNTPEVGTKRGMQTSCLASTVLTHTCTQRRKATQERKVKHD
jgi:hypothetical protein